MTLRAFVVGLPKCGTMTLNRALTKSGWVTAHWLHGEGKGNRKVVGRAIYRKHNAGEDPIGELGNLDAVTQGDFLAGPHSLWPQMDTRLLESVRAHHPDCVFILNTRDPVKAAASMCRWANFQERLDRLGAPGIRPGEASNPANIERWIAWHYDHVRAWFRGRSDFLEYDIEDEKAPALIGGRLGIELAWWGIANPNPIRELANDSAAMIVSTLALIAASSANASGSSK